MAEAAVIKMLASSMPKKIRVMRHVPRVTKIAPQVLLRQRSNWPAVGTSAQPRRPCVAAHKSMPTRRTPKIGYFGPLGLIVPEPREQLGIRVENALYRYRWRESSNQKASEKKFFQEAEAWQRR